MPEFRLAQPLVKNRSGANFASVIVLSHDRKLYLRGAIESVLAQDIDRNRYEIIVVKNYRDEAIDSFLSHANVHSIFCDAKSTTEKAAEGFRVSRGDVLLFLDDDDLFEPNRLSVILTQFDNRPELGFYRNELTFIGSDGERLSAEKARAFGVHAPKRNPRLYIECDKKYANSLRIANVYYEFNSSSMAIRRELFEQGLPYLPRMATSLDTLLWFEGFASDYSMVLDNQALTRYRIHETNVSLVRGQSHMEREARMLEISRSHDHDYHVVRDFVVSTGRPLAIRQIEARILTSRLAMLLRDPFSRRRDFLRLYLAAVHYYDTVAIWRAAGEFRVSLLYLIAPSSARRLYQRAIGIG